MSKAVARVATWLRSRLSADGGFTLVEIVISVSLLGLITGAATTSMITATNGARITSQRAHESTDAQLISAFLVRDAQAAGGSNPATGTVDSSLGVTAAPPAISTDACTPANTRVRFKWIDRTTPSHANTVAYALDTATHQLVRRSCRDDVSSGDMVLGTRVASFTAVCNPNVCPGLPNLVTVTVTELADPSYSQFTYDLVAQLRPEAQAAPSVYNSTPVPLMALGGASCPSSHAFIDLHGSSTLQVQLGGVIVNSSVAGCAAVNVGGAGTYSAGSTSVLAPNTCAAALGCSPFTQPLPDPLAGLPTPTGTCSGGGNPPLANGRYQPGVYNNAVTISPSTTAIFDDGTYIFCNGLDVKGTVQAPHVLFYFAGGSLTVNSNGKITIASQASGPYVPVSIWQPHNFDVKINGGAGLDSYKGAIYAPLSVVYITGNTDIQIGSVIAYAIDIGGGGYAAFGPGVTIVTPALPPAFLGVPYSVTLAAAGGPPTPTPPPALPRYRNWQVSGLPGGWAIDAMTGLLTGTPNAVISYTVVILVTDYVPIIPITTTRTYTLNVGSGSLAIVSTSPLAQATASTNYSMTFQASGGNLGLTGAYQWTNSTPLPAGLSWTGSGVISGSPTATTTFDIRVTDDANISFTKSFTLTVNPLPVITTGAALLSTKGATFSKPQTFTGGTIPFIGWGIRVGDSLPGGLSIDLSDGRIFGTPTTAGTTSFTVVLTDARGAQATMPFTMTVYATPLITTALLPSWDAGTPYPSPTQLTSSGGSPPLNWSATGMPPGLTLSSSGAVLGKPTTAGNYSIVVTATDQSSVSSALATFSVLISAALAIATPSSLPNGELLLGYGPVPATSTGGTGTKTWTAANLPPGVVISGAGVISGTPTTAGGYTPTITVQDAIGVFVSRTLPKVTIFPALSATFSNTFFNWDAGATSPNYTPPAAPIVSGGSGAYTWSVAGLPAGLALNASTGGISGTPSTAWSYNPITWTVSDSLGASIFRTYGPVTVYSALGINTGGVPSTSVVGAAFNGLLAATGGSGNFSWSATGLPAGVMLSSTGALSGSPTANATYAVNFTVTDNGTGGVGAPPAASTVTFTINTYQPLGWGPLPTPPSVWTAGFTYVTQPFTTTGGLAPVAWLIMGLPAGMSSVNGQISGAPTTAAAATTITVKATDAIGQTLTRTFSLTINPTLTLSPSSTPKAAWTVGRAYPSVTYTTTGGTPAVVVGATGVPAGMTFSGGVLSGTPATSGTSTVTVTATDAGGGSRASSFTLTINAPPSLSGSLLIGDQSVGYSSSLTLSGGTGPFTWSASGLPTGLTINSSSGAITGTPTVAGTFTVPITVSDAAGSAVSVSATVTIRPLPTPVSISLNNTGGTVGKIEKGDTISVAFSQALDSTSICAAWTGVAPLAGNNNVTATVNNNDAANGGRDSITVTAASCTGGLQFGKIDLGSSGFVTTNIAFGGSGGSGGSNASSISWASNTLTVVLGQASPASATWTSVVSTAVYTPPLPPSTIKSALGVVVSGTASLTGTSPNYFF